jgi:hypothetical protein
VTKKLEIEYLELEIQMYEVKADSIIEQLGTLNNWEMWVGKIQNEDDGVRKRELYFIKNNSAINLIEQKLEKVKNQINYLKRKLYGKQNRSYY